MQFSNTSTRNIAYGVLGLLALIIFVNSFNIKNSIINSVFGVKNIDAIKGNYENGRQYYQFKEGFSNNKDSDNEKYKYNTDTVDDDNIDLCIKRKLDSLKTELGNKKGISDIKKILNNAKEACNYEATKCMMNLLSDNKNTKTVDLENILKDPDNKDCKRCKDYTELSDKLKHIIDNI